VKRGLLCRRRERPGDLQPSVGSEYEPQLARRPQTLGPVGTEGRARTILIHGAQPVALKEALLTARLLNCSAFRHYPVNSPLRPDARLLDPASKRTSRRRRGLIPGKRKNFTSVQNPSNCGIFSVGVAIS
jgi:hypothetical protein